MNSNRFGIAIFVSATLISSPLSAEVCLPNPGSGPDVCVDWDLPSPPLPNVDFSVFYDLEPAFPDLLLITGANWRIWSENESDPMQPGDIGDIVYGRPATITVLMLRPDGTPAFNNTARIDLNPLNGFGSAISPGSTIAGNTVGEIRVESGIGAAGSLDLTVSGTIRGDVHAGTIGTLLVGGSITGEIRCDVLQSLSVGGDCEGKLNAVEAEMITINGDMELGASIQSLSHLTVGGVARGNIEITELAPLGTIEIGENLDAGCLSFEQPLRGGTVKILGDVARTASMIFYGLESVCAAPNPCVYSLVSLNENGGETWGNIDIRALPNQSGISQNQNFRLYGPLMSSGSIEIDRPIRGILDLKKAGAGTIFTGNGGQIVGPGQVILGYDENAIWSGSAEFDGINIGSSNQNGHLRIGTLKGSVTMSEQMQGVIRAKSVILGASINLNASQSGDIFVEGDLEGDILSTSSKNLSGSVNIEGDLGKGARIIYEGLANGLIDVKRETAAGSLIHLAGGLGSAGRVVVNSAQGDFDAIGSIHVGKLVTTFPLSSVVYDGSIRVLRGSPDGGNLLGVIAVTGCHATLTTLDICVCGHIEGDGKINIQQSGCLNQPLYACVSGCP